MKAFKFSLVYGILLTAATTFSLLDTFVISKTGSSGSYILPTLSESSSSESSATSVAPVFTEYTYQDSDISIEIDTLRRFETEVYAAVIHTPNHRYLQSAFGFDRYGKNLNEKTSTIASRKDALLAINGDYYGFRDYGFVVRNGIVYRTTPRPSSSDDALLLNDDGQMAIIEETTFTEESLANREPWQVWSFGPTLIKNSILQVDANSKVPNELTSNPRTAIGQINHDTYIMVVSDGRTTESAGLSLLELASVFREYDATLAYNLDGGGSSTMWFHGRIINKPVNHGSTIEERAISDIIYIGY